MSDIRFKWSNKAFYDLRRAPKVINELEARGRRVRDAANATMKEKKGYRLSSFQGQRKPYGRWFVQVYTASRHAMYSNAKNNTLIKALEKAK
jgi:hypothetical protein